VGQSWGAELYGQVAVDASAWNNVSTPVIDPEIMPTPTLEVTYDIDATGKKLTLTINNTRGRAFLFQVQAFPSGGVTSGLQTGTIIDLVQGASGIENVVGLSSFQSYLTLEATNLVAAYETLSAADQMKIVLDCPTSFDLVAVPATFRLFITAFDQGKLPLTSVFVKRDIVSHSELDILRKQIQQLTLKLDCIEEEKEDTYSVISELGRGRKLAFSKDDPSSRANSPVKGNLAGLLAK